MLVVDVEVECGSSVCVLSSDEEHGAPQCFLPLYNQTANNPSTRSRLPHLPRKHQDFTSSIKHAHQPSLDLFLSALFCSIPTATSGSPTFPPPPKLRDLI